jgi:cytoskeleton protein RodZ
MSQFGDQLRAARESQGISIAQAALETRILQRYIAALEEGDFQQLPGDVYARGFVRNYAHYLGLPSEELIEAYRRERGATDRIVVVPTAKMPRVHTYVLPNFLGVFLITCAIVVVAYFSLSWLGRIGTAPEVATLVDPTPMLPTPTALATQAVVSTPVVVPSLAPSSLAQVGPTSLVAGGVGQPTSLTPQPSATPEAPIMLKVTIKENSIGSWLRIQVDGETQFEGIMAGGTTQDFQAKRRVFIRSGNPAVVFVSVNGMEPQVLSPLAGQPTNWEWPPQ